MLNSNSITFADTSLSSLSLLVDPSAHGTAVTKGAKFEIMDRLSSIIPWTKLQHPSNMHSGSRTSAALSMLMPELEQGHPDLLSLNLSTSKSGVTDHLSVVLYLLSNCLTSRDIRQRREKWLFEEDELIIKLLKDANWDDLRHLKILLSIRDATAESIAEKVFASAIRSGEFEIVHNMLRSGMSVDMLVEVIVAEGISFLTPLQYAVESGNDRLFGLLINYGADVDYSFHGDGKTALWYAIRKKREFNIRALLLRGATSTRECVRVAAVTKPDEIKDFSLVEHVVNIYLQQSLDQEYEAQNILLPAVSRHNIPIIQRFLASDAELNGLTPPMYLDGHGPFQTTLLGRAVLTMNIDIVRLLIHVSPGADRFPRWSTYIPPLALAAKKGLTDISELLINSGADIEAADEGEVTLLERAARINSLALCQILIKHGAKVDREPHDRHRLPSALMIAVQQRCMDIIDLLIDSRARMNDEFEVAPSTVLAAAIEIGNQEMITKLRTAGASLVGFGMSKIGNLQNAILLHKAMVLPTLLHHHGPKILAAAVSDRDDDLAQFLLQNVADMWLKAEQITTSTLEAPLRAATRTYNIPLIQALLTHGATVTDLVLAEAVNEIGLLPTLLLRFSGNAPTAVACALINNSMLGLELLRRANVGLTGVSEMTFHKKGSILVGKSVLEIAVHKANSSHLKYLLEWASATRTSWSSEATTRALTAAILFKRHDHLVVLMKFDYNRSCDLKTGPHSFRFVEEWPDREYTPLQAAVKEQLVWVVRELLTRADVNYLGEGSLRRTPLQLAVDNGNMEIFNLLVDHGADVNGPAAFDGGATALQIAAIHGYIGIAQILLDLGADVNQEPAALNGRTALMGAAEHGRIDMLHLLLNRGALVVGDGEEYYHEAVKLAEGHGHYAAARLLASFRNLTELNH